MAGEIEEPFSLSFQTDSLHSGSISFGRFENEPLSWERRSSFSHNRYLEEVEKCSKPGSVIEKKAYFEAHFKRKALLLQGSSECQNANEDETGENDFFENEGCRDGYENVTEGSRCDQFDGIAFENVDVHYAEDLNGNEESHNYHFDENVSETAYWRQEFDDGNERSQYYFANETSKFTHFDESPERSEYHGELDVMECEREDPSVLPAESPMKAALANADGLVNTAPEDVNTVETCHTGIVCDKSLPSNDEAEIELQKNRNNDAVDVNESSKAINLSPKSATSRRVGKSSLENRKNLSPKLRIAVENKSIKPQLNSQSHVQKPISLKTSKTAAKSRSRIEKECPGRIKAEKQSLQASTPVRRSSQRSPKTQDSESSATKSKVENKSSEKDQMRAKKVAESQPSASKNIDPRGHQTPNRLKQTAADSSKLQFQFYMKLEEKMHAKEAEMNQMQAKTQEKRQAEIRQFRKTLNFKATPMPSFYQATAWPGSDGNKTPATIRHKSTSPGTKSTARSPMLSKARKDRGLTMTESVNTADKPESSEVSKSSTTDLSEVSSAPQSHSSIHHEARMKNGNTERKPREKERSPSLQKYRVSETSKATKDNRSEVKPKVGARRNSNEMMRKNMKGIGLGSSSGIGSLAVGVAS
ncbi:hypothetical protein Patl1_15301 [Pistacia atlantica]|uniref:Uncharacterized protein n=1 Tax=Pistacia atlantica TaxID=434234 RepID=A0ACC1B9D7_9ROSI|nr:hypothetical protein Patl1_15301 [Pistacia atlantica]